MLSVFFKWVYINIQILQAAIKNKSQKIYHIYQMTDTINPFSIKDKAEEDFLDSLSVESDLLLSKIEYDEVPPQSPQINYNKAEAKIKELTETADPLPFKKSKPFCGCGQTYSCTSSLYLHIRSKHEGKPPVGTIGGPKGIVKKPAQPQPVVKVQEDANSNYNKFPQFFKDNKVTPNKPVSNLASSELKQPPNNIIQENNTSAYIDRSKKKQIPIQLKKACKLCGKTYVCNSSLNLHLKRKHQIRKTWDGRTEVSAKVQDKVTRTFQCSMCGLSYGSKSALGLHYNNKHISKTQNDQGAPYDDNIIQKCGCGLVYQSRSALNMHVKKKHNGDYPEGTTQKPNLRQSGQYRDERQEQNHIEHYLAQNRSSSQNEQEQSIYDSQSDGDKGQQKVQKVIIHPYKRNDQQINKPYKCGCGRPYSCSSSLNLHIKKNHNWVVPQGTIGGPRGMRFEEQSKQQKPVQHSVTQNAQQCSQCQKKIDGSFFQCKSCTNHQLCSKCFWNGDNASEEHKWQVIKIKT